MLELSEIIGFGSYLYTVVFISPERNPNTLVLKLVQGS